MSTDQSRYRGTAHDIQSSSSKHEYFLPHHLKTSKVTSRLKISPLNLRPADSVAAGTDWGRSTIKPSRRSLVVTRASASTLDNLFEMPSSVAIDTASFPAQQTEVEDPLEAIISSRTVSTIALSIFTVLRANPISSSFDSSANFLTIIPRGINLNPFLVPRASDRQGAYPQRSGTKQSLTTYSSLCLLDNECECACIDCIYPSLCLLPTGVLFLTGSRYYLICNSYLIRNIS